MTTIVQMLVDRPDGAGGTYAKDTTYGLADDLAAYFIGIGAARRTSLISETTDYPAALNSDGRRYDIEDEVLPVTAKKSLTGGIGIQVDSNKRYPLTTGPRGLVEILPTSDVAMWNTDKTAAVTVSVDETVTFEGRPTIKVVIPAGTSGTIKVGTNAANARVPYSWDKTNFLLAIKSDNLALANGFTVYLGDATYANFFTSAGQGVANFPEMKYDANRWIHFKPDASGSYGWVTGAGSPAVASLMRAKIQFTATSQVTDTTIWIGCFGVMPKRVKPTIVWTLDDGYASWYSFAAPLFKHYDMPVTMGIASALVGTANFMSSAQIQTLFNDPTRLFDIINHSTNNDSHDALGAAAYFANVQTCRDYLRGLGIYGDGPLHHPYVQSVWSNTLADLMRNDGFLSARASSYTASAGRDQALTDDALRWKLNICTNLQTGKSLAQAQTDINTVKTNGGFGMINAHDFATAADAYIWDYDSMEQLVGWVAAERDAGNLEVKSWSRWYADLTGRLSDRR